jgi:hypothetical protein
LCILPDSSVLLPDIPPLVSCSSVHPVGELVMYECTSLALEREWNTTLVKHWPSRGVYALLSIDCFCTGPREDCVHSSQSSVLYQSRRRVCTPLNDRYSTGY